MHTLYMAYTPCTAQETHVTWDTDSGGYHAGVGLAV
jgi:hypothetical protein